MRNKSIDEFAFNYDLKPFNITLPEWTAIWWKWFHSIPMNRSPALDYTGEFCGAYQNDPNVWFLAGTLGGYAVRKCTIPEGKALFFPIITCIFSFILDPHLKSEGELLTAVTNDVDNVRRIILKIDDSTFEDLTHFRVRSEVFDDIIDTTRTRTVSDGYWAFLRPLSIGNHVINFMGENSVGENIDFFNEVTYHLSIVPN